MSTKPQYRPIRKAQPSKRIQKVPSATSRIGGLYDIIPEEAQGIDPDLLDLAFSQSLSGTGSALKAKYEEKYGITSYQSLEFLGDGVLEILLKYLLYQRLHSQGPGDMTNALWHLRSNAFFNCLAKDVICGYVRTSAQSVNLKTCADVFEALFGALFIYLIDNEYDAFSILYYWLIEFWQIEKYLDDYIAKRTNSCFPEGYKKTFTQGSFFDALSQLDTQELDDIYREVGRLLSSRGTKDPRTALNEFYQKNRLGQVEYQGGRGENVRIPCPLSICPEGGVLGQGRGSDLSSSRKLAAEDAITNLRSRGFTV